MENCTNQLAGSRGRAAHTLVIGVRSDVRFQVGGFDGDMLRSAGTTSDVPGRNVEIAAGVAIAGGGIAPASSPAIIS
jgi:hypothetical protein